MGDIRIIDFQELGLNKEESAIDKDCIERIGQQVKNACSSVGFCYIKNHGIDQKLIDNFRSSSRAFFEQPESVKQQFARGKENFGWIALEKEHLNPERPSGDLKEAFNYCPCNEPGASNWSNVEAFQNFNREVFAKCTDLSFRMCDALSIALGLEKSFLRDAHKKAGKAGNPTTIRSLYYPPVPEYFVIKPGQIRSGEHADFGSISFVFQDGTGGLEESRTDHGYVPATCVPGTIIVNIGELMERWTAHALVATKHRVLIPESETKRRKYRQSAVFFLYPDDDVVVKCLDGSNKYEPITALDYLNMRFGDIFGASK